MKSLLVAAVALLAPAVASAQTPFTGGGGEMPSTLDPGATGTQITPPPPSQTPSAPRSQSPNVMVVGPDGKVTKIQDDQGANAPSNYYITDGSGPTEPDQIHGGPTPELHVVRRGDTRRTSAGTTSMAVAQDLVVQPADHEPALDLPRRPRAPASARRVLCQHAKRAGDTCPAAGQHAPAGQEEPGLAQAGRVRRAERSRQVDHDRRLGRREDAVRRRRRGHTPQLPGEPASPGSARSIRSTSRGEAR